MSTPSGPRPWTLRLRLRAEIIAAPLVLVLATGAAMRAQTQTVTYIVLHNFTLSDGGNPLGAVIMDKAGNLYGTTALGGASGACCGTVFKLDTSGNETVLHSFTGSPGDGANPFAGLVMDAAGNLYGTTVNGGASSACSGGCGTVFKLDTSGNLTVLHSFTSSPGDGAHPNAGLIMDVAGNLYGTTTGGGTGPCNGFSSCGTVFKLDASGNETVLHTFTGSDGAGPYASLLMDAVGNLYGTTAQGGAIPNCGSGCGTVFKLDASGNFTVLHSFTGSPADGFFSKAGLIMDAAGNLYGTTLGGTGTCTNPSGIAGCGIVFRLDASGSETVLHNFTGSPDGQNPAAALIMDRAGNLYGTTYAGGASSGCASGGCGTVFMLDASRNEIILHSYTNFTASDGAEPAAAMIMDGAGNLYGTTNQGGASGYGTVFKLTLPVATVPAITSISPASATAGGAAFTLTVNGTNFLSSSTVNFNGNARLTSFVSGTQLTAAILASDIATGGNFSVTVINPGLGGGSSNAVSFTVNNPAPTITTISPTSALAGGASFTLTVNGMGFVSTSAVSFGANARATTFVSATQLTAAISASDIATGGNFNVTVANPAPGGGTSNAVSFTVNNPVPTITTISPASATAGGAAFTLTVNGTGFVSTSVVNYGGNVRATTQVSSTQLTASISASDIATAGTFNVTVTNPSPGGGTSNAVSFTVNNPVATVTSISPTSALAGGAAFTLTVNGTGFVSTSGVSYGGNVRATTQVSSTQLTASISASDIATAGNFNVTVFNPPPGGGTSNAVNFTVTDFSIAVASGGSATATITAGQTASYNLQVSPSNGFTGTVNLTCSGAPSLATCTPAPSNPAVNGTSTPFTVSVSTMAPSIAGFLGRGPAGAPLSGSIGALLGVVMLMVLTGTTLGMRRPQRTLARVLAVIALALLSGCGGGSVNTTPIGGTPKGAYTLTVTGSSGGANRTILLKLTVN